VSICTTYAGMQSPKPPEGDLGFVRAPAVTRPDPGARRGPGSKPHVCFVAPTAWPVISGSTSIKVVGGAEVQQGFIARALVQRGYRVSMICHDYGQPERTVVDGITVHRAHRPDSGLPVVRFVHPRMTAMWHALKKVGADIYYQRTSDVLTTLVVLFCKRHGKHSVYSAASDMDFVPGQEEIDLGRDRFIFRIGLRRADRIVVQNPGQQRQCRRAYGRESTLIPSCYVPPAGARADRAGYVLWVARMGDSKRPELALEIARRVPQHRFVIVGGPGDGGEAQFQAMAREAAKLPNVELTGFVPYANVDGYFNGARVLLNTSKFEGFPNTFLQGWSRGIPTVAFIDTESREDGEPVTGLARDADDAAAQVAALMSDDIAWHQASQRCLRHFRRVHSVEAMLIGYEHLLMSLGSRL
jgi:glycosyltransferase involved in cell wall biosynthesis